MADIPTRVRQVAPSGRVAGAVIPFDIADTGQGIEAQGLAGLGRGVGDLGISLGKIAFAEGASEASTARGLADSEIRLLQESLKKNNDPNTYDAELTKSLEVIQGFRPESGVGGKQFDDFLEDAVPAWQSGVNILKIQRTQSNIEAAYITNFARASAAGDIVELNRLIDEAVNTTGVITPEQGARDLASGEAVVNRINKQKDETTVLEAAFAVWRDTGQLKDGLAVINSSGIDDKARVENEFKTRVINRRAEEKIKLEEQQEIDRGTINKAMYVDKNYSVSFDAIRVSSLSEKDKALKFKENEDRARLASIGEPEKNDSGALDAITTVIAQVGNDTLPLADAKAIYNEKSPFLKSTTADELLKELNKAFDASVDTAAARVRTDVRLRAVGRTESALDRLLEALAGAPAKDQEPLERRIASAREKFNLELSNFNRWEETHRAWRRTNNKATPEQIQQEGMRSWFTEFAGKNISQLRREEEPGTVPGEEPKAKIPALTTLSPIEEQFFRVSFAKIAKENNLNPDPDDPRHFYDYRALFEETGKLKIGPQKHFPSKFKILGHPNLIVNGRDTRTGEQATPELIAANTEANKKVKSLSISPPTERVRMISPDGKTGTIPQDKVEQAIKFGWKKL